MAFCEQGTVQAGIVPIMVWDCAYVTWVASFCLLKDVIDR